MSGGGVTQKDLCIIWRRRQVDILHLLTMEPIDFQFPYTPYAIQKEFMAALYETLSAGKIGIFESPTGTVRRDRRHRSSLKGSPPHSGQIA